jgi:hypothetical protein
MLQNEWGELALVSARIEALNQRREAVDKIGNAARVRELALEISVAQTQRNRLVETIMAHLVEAA